MKTYIINRRSAEMAVVGLSLLGDPGRIRFDRELRSKFFYRDLELIFNASLETTNGDPLETAEILSALDLLGEAGGVEQILKCMEVAPLKPDVNSLIEFISENME